MGLFDQSKIQVAQKISKWFSSIIRKGDLVHIRIQTLGERDSFHSRARGRGNSIVHSYSHSQKVDRKENGGKQD